MGRLAGKLSAFAVLVLLAVALAACGGGDEESDSQGTTTAAQEKSGGDEARTEGGGSSAKNGSAGQGAGTDRDDSGSGSGGSGETSHEDSGGGAQQFRVRGGDNSIQEFGGEADEGEFDQAAAAVHGFFDARVRGDWEAACTYVAQDIVETLSPLMENLGEDAGCSLVLETLSGSAPKAALKAAARADIGSVRVEDDQAFVLYHGAAGIDYAMPMKLEDGEWKVASLAGTPIS